MPLPRSTLFLLVAGVSSLACSTPHRAVIAPATPPVAKPSTGPQTAERIVRDTVVDPELARRAARLELQILEKDAQIEELEARLDDARAEVVRTMSKLQTLANRPEAASAVAEAEVALQSLKLSAVAQRPEIAQVSSLVAQASAEFNSQNYGGALYLAGQAKALAASSRRLSSGGRGTARPGETAFSVPLRLKSTTRGNVRDGPGTSFAVAFAVEAGSALAGYSYVEEWIRVSDDSGRTGWIFRALVARR